MAVGLVDSDSMRRAVWAERLSAWGFPIAWEAATAAEARAAQARHPPSALLVAFELLDGGGAALLAAAIRAQPECSGLLLVEVPHPAREALAWKAGARGCLWRGQPCERLLAAVRQALAGTSLWTPGAVRQAQRWWASWGDPWAALSPQQRAVAWAAAHGLSNKEIARVLGIAPETARTHLARALARLGRVDRVDLTRWLAQGGLLDPRCAALLDEDPLPDFRQLIEALMGLG
jgi:DNA-binding NarL/FixJ family response regulator